MANLQHEVFDEISKFLKFSSMVPCKVVSSERVDDITSHLLFHKFQCQTSELMHVMVVSTVLHTSSASDHFYLHNDHDDVGSLTVWELHVSEIC